MVTFTRKVIVPIIPVMFCVLVAGCSHESAPPLKSPSVEATRPSRTPTSAVFSHLAALDAAKTSSAFFETLGSCGDEPKKMAKAAGDASESRYLVHRHRYVLRNPTVLSEWSDRGFVVVSVEGTGLAPATPDGVEKLNAYPSSRAYVLDRRTLCVVGDAEGEDLKAASAALITEMLKVRPH